MDQFVLFHKKLHTSISMMLSGWFQPGVNLRRIVKKIAENVFGGNKYFEPISLLSCSITQPFMDSNPLGVNFFGGSLSYRQNSVPSHALPTFSLQSPL